VLSLYLVEAAADAHHLGEALECCGNPIGSQMCYCILQRVADEQWRDTSAMIDSARRREQVRLIIPFAFDQPFWGGRTAALGAGPPPLPYQELEAGQLADTLQQLVNDPQLQTGARAIGRRLEAEDGVVRAATLIDQLWCKCNEPRCLPTRQHARSQSLLILARGNAQ
jgi:hypothetical protein